MVETIQKLKADITECMLRKFGGEIDFDEMEESILRRLVAEEQSPVKDLIKAYERRIYDMQVSTHGKHQLFIVKHSLGRLLDYVYSVHLIRFNELIHNIVPQLGAEENISAFEEKLMCG